MPSKKNKSVVIFDCDGVMFDSRQANINYYNYLLSRFGLPPMTDDKIDFIHSYTADESVRYIFGGTPYLEQAMELKKGIDYTPFIRDMVMEPGLRELLDKLKPDFGLAVATNRSTTMPSVIEY
ncbi:HAD family hydrolase, partial [bacterium]|nr:HAD family hydrolase [bacterium]